MVGSLCTPTVAQLVFWCFLHYVLFCRAFFSSEFRWEILYFIFNFWGPHFALLLLQKYFFEAFYITFCLWDNGYFWKFQIVGEKFFTLFLTFGGLTLHSRYCCKIQFSLLFICHSSYMRRKHQNSNIISLAFEMV